MDLIDYIYRDGQLYDRTFAHEQDLAFWLKQAQSYGGPILELAGGTGRITLPLAKAGFQVTGIDYSEAMLAEARRKSAEENVAVTWVKADMRYFDLGQTFALIILGFNTLCHLHTLSDFAACMNCVKSHLAPGGKFIIDVFVPKIELLVNRPGERSPFAAYDDLEGRGRVVVTESYVYEPDTQIKRIQFFHQFPGSVAEIEGELNLRMYFPQELDALLTYNGFVIEGKFGNYDQTRFDAKSEKQLIVCSAEVKP
jgi:SAM-dependent methyltransferase